MPEENLQATVTLTITGFTYLKDININLTTALSETPNKPGVYKDTDYTNTGYQEALDAKLVGALPLQNITLTNAELLALTDSEADIYCTVEKSANTATVVIKVNFSWGEKFGQLNPGKFYNSINVEAEDVDKKATGDAAVKDLKDIEGYLKE